MAYTNQTTPFTGVGYYNIDNKDNKDNKDNAVISPLGLEANASLRSQENTLDQDFLSQEEGEAYKESVATASPTPEDDLIDQDYVHRALFTFYDNGENSKQRFKIKITINPAEAPNERVEFIGTLTKDRRNFKKHLPEGENQILEFVDGIRSYTKQAYGNYPYIGKIHLNHGWNTQQEQRNQNEPYSAVAVWWDGAGWVLALTIYNWQHKIDLSKQGLTAFQKKTNAVAHAFWQNPTYQTKTRNKTFRDLRKQSK